MASVGMLEVRGPGTKREYLLNGQPVSLGRSADNAVVLDDASVSCLHARIEWLGPEPLVTDLGSANATLVNGTMAEPHVSVPLMPGDVIQIVDFQLTLHEARERQAGRADVSAQPLPSAKPALLTRAEPGSVTLLVST